jgi:hypothetical protein
LPFTHLPCFSLGGIEVIAEFCDNSVPYSQPVMVGIPKLQRSIQQQRWLAPDRYIPRCRRMEAQSLSLPQRSCRGRRTTLVWTQSPACFEHGASAEDAMRRQFPACKELRGRILRR